MSAEIYSAGKTDECYTPAVGVLPLLKHMYKTRTYWLPFDTEESEFVKVFRQYGFSCIPTHIDSGQDFFKFTPDFKFDSIVSNPPFTNKAKIFERALSFNKPFALLMTNSWLNDSAPKRIFKNHDLELLMFEERMKFKGKDNKITFSSSYFCHDFLGKQIVMDSLKNYESLVVRA